MLGRGTKVGATAGNSDAPGRKEGGTGGARIGRTWEQEPPGMGRLVGSSGRKCPEEEEQRSRFRRPDTERKRGVEGQEPLGVVQIKTERQWSSDTQDQGVTQLLGKLGKGS